MMYVIIPLLWSHQDCPPSAVAVSQAHVRFFFFFLSSCSLGVNANGVL